MHMVYMLQIGPEFFQNFDYQTINDHVVPQYTTLLQQMTAFNEEIMPLVSFNQVFFQIFDDNGQLRTLDQGVSDKMNEVVIFGLKGESNQSEIGPHTELYNTIQEYLNRVNDASSEAEKQQIVQEFLRDL